MSLVQKREEARFRDHVRRLSVRNFPSNQDGFDDELIELGKIDQRVRSNLDEFYTASLGSSMAKNRFDDVKPNEQTIVKLRPTSKRGEGMYINANYVDAREAMGVPFVYIATQAPMQNTVLDFWRMVYENDTAFIVMLCAVKENGKVKSETYWPAQGQVYDLGLLSVATLSENVRSDSVHRTMLLRTVRGDEKEIYHMQYLAWPDQGIPTTSIPLMEMIQAIGKSRRSVESPIVVHCSGGIGRTGVFIGLHIALAQFQLERAGISVLRIVRFMKLCRSGMVQRKDQYMYLYYSVQREMERMILSAERGVNLLDIRPRNQPVPRPEQSAPGYSRPLLIGQPSLVGARSAPGVHPMPDRSSTFTTAVTNLLRSSSPHRGDDGRQDRTGRSRAAPPRRNRDVVTDLVAMEDYLRRNPSMRAYVQADLTGGDGGGDDGASARDSDDSHDSRGAQQASDSRNGHYRLGRKHYIKGGKSYEGVVMERPKRSGSRRGAGRSRHADDSGRERLLVSASPAQGTGASSPPPPPADAASYTKIEAQLTRIQGLNQKMRSVASDDVRCGNGREEAEEHAGRMHQEKPQHYAAVIPLSIARDTPRTRESSPRIAMSARQRSRPNPQDEDLAYVRNRVVTRDEWRRL